MANSSQSLKVLEKNPVLKKLTDARSYQDAVRIADNSLSLLGEGSARRVYDLGGKYVLKLAKTKSGIAQNKVEINNTPKSKIINPVLVSDPSGRWIITYFAKPVSVDQWNEISGTDFYKFGDALLYKFNQEDTETWPKPDNYDKISSNPFFQAVAQFVTLTDSQVGDLVRDDLTEDGFIQNWGLVKNKLVLTDFGLNRDVFDSFYV